MNILKQIILWFSAIIIVGGADIFALPIILLLCGNIIKKNWCKLIVHGIGGFIGHFLAIFIVIKIAYLLKIKPSILIIIIPILLMYRNDMGRIRQAKSGQSRVAKMLMSRGLEYDQKFHVYQEWTVMICSFVGLAVGIVVFKMF